MPLKDKNKRRNYMIKYYQEHRKKCPECGKLISDKSLKCHSCSQKGKKNHEWKGGICLDMEEWRKNYRKNPEVKKRNTQDNKKWIQNNPEKKRAQRLAHKNIKIPIGQLCEFCNNELAVHRHHGDYSKPLEVKFLCIKCHIKYHTFKRKINEWHNMVVTGLVGGLTHTIPDGRTNDIKWVRGRLDLWEAFGRCVYALSVGNSYESDEKELKEIAKYGYKKENENK